MRTPPISLAYFLLAAIFGAVGQFLYKTGAERAKGPFLSYILNVPILAGVVSYVAVMVLFVAAFKHGGAPSVLYPTYATTFIWAAIIAWWAHDVPIKPIHVVGMVCLVLGMYLMGK